jgi:hypothetical protein
MKIFGICLVKNEVDIIEYCLTESSKWAHKIFVYDNGSDDNTWELVCELAKTNPTIVPYKKEALPFRDELRVKVFNEYRHLVEEGDWWCFRLDCDEFYIDDPREFLKHVPSRYHVVAKASYDYRLTFEDVEEFQFEDHSPHDAEQLMYYNPLLYTEKRFFKHRKALIWPETDAFPLHMGILYPEFIRQKHIQYRSPNQIKARLEKKREATKSGYTFFKKHDFQDDWKELLDHRENLIRESSDWKFDGYKYPDLFKKSAKRMIFERLMHALRIYP